MGVRPLSRVKFMLWVRGVTINNMMKRAYKNRDFLELHGKHSIGEQSKNLVEMW